MTSAVGIYFNTFRDCLVFLQWFYVELRGDKLRQVVEKLHTILHPYYKDVDIGKIQSDLYKFLSKVDTFYGKLAVKKWEYVNSINSNAKPEDLVDALLVCLPKFFSVIYYIWYDVNPNFERLGGGRWKYNYPGYDGWDLLGRKWGGDLQKYLTGTTNDENRHNSNLLPGGFLEGDIKYGYNDKSGFYQGRSMIEELRNLVDKTNTKWNLFRDVFPATVLPTNAGSYTPNIANVLAVVDVFCDIVVTERYVIDLETHEGLKKTHIHWTELVDHCKIIRYPLGKIFQPGAFSFTGYNRDQSELNTVGFARRTAAWLRGNLDDVIKGLAKIVPYAGKKYYDIFATNKQHFMIKDYLAELHSYFTTNFFPYGFTFDGEYFRLPSDPHKTLSGDWNSAIMILKGDNGLKKLKKLLEGLEYPKGHVHGEHGHSTSDKSRYPVVSTTEGPKHVIINNDETENRDNDDSNQISETTGDRDGFGTKPDDIKDSQVTSDISISSGEGSNGSENLNGDEQTKDKRGDEHDPLCDNVVPDMNSFDHEECFLHKRHDKPITG